MIKREEVKQILQVLLGNEDVKILLSSFDVNENPKGHISGYDAGTVLDWIAEDQEPRRYVITIL